MTNAVIKPRIDRLVNQEIAGHDDDQVVNVRRWPNVVVNQNTFSGPNLG